MREIRLSDTSFKADFMSGVGGEGGFFTATVRSSRLLDLEEALEVLFDCADEKGGSALDGLVTGFRKTLVHFNPNRF